MMASILDLMMGTLQSSGGIGQMSRSLGIGESDVTKVVSGALPLLMGGLTRNAASAEGATGLLAALDRDHDGSVIDDLAGFLATAGAAAAGTGILQHTFGARQGQVENALSRSTGIDAATGGKILAMAAPLVLGYLGRQRREQNLDAAGLASFLGREQQVAQERAPEAIDMLTRLLDTDDDGSIMDDVAEMGSGLLGSLFKQA
jgi:hypothetical protein